MTGIKVLIILCLMVSMCFALDDDNQGVARKKKYHKYHLLYGGGIAYYLIFLAIKVKLIFIIGTTIAAAIFVGKIFAFLKYITLWLEEKKSLYSSHPVSHDENIILHADPHEHHEGPWSSGGGSPWSSGPGEEYYHRKNDYKPSYTGPYKTDYSTIKDDSYISYARSIGDTMFDNVDIVKDIVHRLDLTEYTFDEMNIKDDICRRRFVCEADYRARENSLLGLGLYMFSDHGLDKYRSEQNVTSIADCQRIYDQCRSFRDTT